MASPVLDAVSASRARGSAAVEVQTSSSFGTGDPWVSTGTGQVDLAKGLGRIAFENAGGGTSELLVNQDGTYVSNDRGASWFLLGFQQTTPLLGSINVFRALSSIEWSDGTPETVDGRALTRYDGTLPDATVADLLDGMGVPIEDPTPLGQATDMLLDVSVWVDGSGNIARILRSASATTPAGPLAATQLTVLTDLGSAIDLASPPEADVQPAPE